MLFEWSWKSGEVPVYGQLANIVQIFKNGKRDNPAHYRPVSLTSRPSRIMEKIFLGGNEKYLKDNIVNGHSQHGFMSGIPDCQI